jgi:hypothetical protein
MKFNSFTKSLMDIVAASIAAVLLLTSCGKKSDPTAVNSSTKTFTSVVTPQTVSNGTANVIGLVTTSDGSAYLKLQVTSTSNLNYVYVTSSQDNGPMAPYIPTSNFTDSLGNTFKAGNSNASYTMSNTKNFVLEIPVSIRTTAAAVSDVYTIWFTSGKGSFTLPAQRLGLGPVTFTLNYSANSGPSYSSATGVVLGDQTATPGSLLVTSGQISALTTALYDSSTTSADIALCALDQATGSVKTNNSGYLFLTSPSKRVSYGWNSEASFTPAPNVTYISNASNTINFATASGNDLANLSVGTSSLQVGPISLNTVYQFTTAKGKNGLIQVTAINITPSGSTATVSVKVQN